MGVGFPFCCGVVEICVPLRLRANEEEVDDGLDFFVGLVVGTVDCCGREDWVFDVDVDDVWLLRNKSAHNDGFDLDVSVCFVGDEEGDAWLFDGFNVSIEAPLATDVE